MLTVHNNTSLTRNLTVTVDGRSVSVAVMTGQVAKGKSMTLSLVLPPESVAADHRDEISAALDLFIADLRDLAAINGLPV